MQAYNQLANPTYLTDFKPLKLDLKSRNLKLTLKSHTQFEE